MNTRVPSLLTRVISAAAERLASDPAVPMESRLAFRQTAEHVMHAQWASMFGGETVWVRIYAPRKNTQAREARRARILAALAADQTTAEIARREAVSARWVQRLRKAANPACMESSQPPVDDSGITGIRTKARP